MTGPARGDALPVEGANRWQGAWTGSLGAGRFPVRAGADPALVVGDFPASDERDVEAALAREPAGAWGARSRHERLERLAEAARRLDARTSDPVARVLGLSEVEGARLRYGFRRALDEVAGRPPRLRAAHGRVLLAPHWSELELAAFRRLAGELLAGSSVLVLGDARLPVAAHELVHALVEAGVGGDELGLLHAPTEGALRLALRHPGVSKVVATGRRELIARVRRETPEERPQELSRLRNGDFEVDAGAELEEQARRLVERAFGRTSTLSGQASGQVGRVHCPPAVFSRFTELFLAACEASRDVNEPLTQIDREAVRAYEARIALGLDEGATLITGGVEDARTLLCRPALFTNVEPRMSLWRRRNPVPVCLLARAE